jgi:hypothetical protein
VAEFFLQNLPQWFATNFLTSWIPDWVSVALAYVITALIHAALLNVVVAAGALVFIRRRRCRGAGLYLART